jgi:hypothetical protein
MRSDDVIEANLKRYLGIHYALEWILTGDLPHGQYLALTQSIRKMTRAVSERTEMVLS